VAPLRLGGLRGKKSTPSVWLGGTGEFLRSASRSRSGRSRNRCGKRIRQRYVPELSRVEWIVIYCCDYGCIVVECCFQSLILCKKKRGGGYFRRSSFLNIVVEGSGNLLWFMLFRFNAVGVWGSRVYSFILGVVICSGLLLLSPWPSRIPLGVNFFFTPGA
jgi:hypothetical protein